MIFRLEVDLSGGGYGYICYTATEVYEDLVYDVTKEEDARNVQKWCWNAKVGDVYNGESFRVYVLEREG